MALDVEAVRRSAVVNKSLSSLFEVGATLGKGGFATVREGVEKASGSHVALKILNPRAYSRDPTAARQVFFEILAMQRVNALKNTNLLRFVGAIEDVSATTGLPRLTIVTELCRGGELFDRIVNRGHYTEKDAAELVAKLARALHDLHSHGIVHRDLKPENVLYKGKEDSSECVICDFGLSKLADVPDPHSNLVGTPGYLSPEIISKRDYSPACDVWALGVITYILLCGYPPFYAESNKELYAQITAGVYEFHADAWGTISEPAKDLVRQMLLVDTSRRVTMPGVLSHPWVTTHAPSNVAHLPNTIRNLKTFNLKRKMRAAAAAAMWGHAHAPVTRDLYGILGDKAFTAEQLTALHASFNTVAAGAKTINVAQFKAVLAAVALTDIPAERVFDLFDSDGSGDVDYREMLAGLARLRGDAATLMRFCFDVFDADKSGFLTRDELVQMLQVTGLLSNSVGASPASSASGASATPVSPIATATYGSPMRMHHDEDHRTIKLAGLFERMDANKDGKISFEEFKTAVAAEPVLGEALFRPLKHFASLRSMTE